MPKGIALEKDVQAAIVTAYRDGQTAVAVAQIYHTTGPTVRKYVERAGIPIRTRGEITTARNRAKGAQIDLGHLGALIDEGFSTTEIAAQLGVSKPTIEMKMRRLGLRSKHGRGSPMEKNYFWKGGRTVDVDGYVLLKVPGHPYADNRGYVREHRLVMEKVLGRYLLPTEVVHHKPGVAKDDNHPDNLEVFATNAEHLRQELTGKTPNYTPEGLQRMRESTRRTNLRRALAKRQALESDARPSP